jgi:hypothetical protein
MADGFSCRLTDRDGSDEHREEGAPKRGEPAQKQAEVAAGGGKYDVGAITVSAPAVIPTHPVLGLDVADEGLDHRAALHLAADGRGSRAVHTLTACKGNPKSKEKRTSTTASLKNRLLQNRNLRFPIRR